MEKSKLKKVAKTIVGGSVKTVLGAPVTAARATKAGKMIKKSTPRTTRTTGANSSRTVTSPKTTATKKYEKY